MLAVNMPIMEDLSEYYGAKGIAYLRMRLRMDKNAQPHHLVHMLRVRPASNSGLQLTEMMFFDFSGQIGTMGTETTMTSS